MSGFVRIGPPWRLWMLLLLLGAGADTADAARATVRGATAISGAPEFSLQVTNRDLGVIYPAEADARIIDTRAISISFYERVSDRIRLGVTGGRIDATQSGRTATRGMTLSGYSLMFSTDATIDVFSRLQLRGGLQLAYTDIDGATDDQRSSLSWSEAVVSATAAVGLSSTLRLFGGAAWTEIDGEETSFGVVESNSDLELDTGQSEHLGLEFLVDRDGLVAVSFERGASEGFYLRFQRRFR